MSKPALGRGLDALLKPAAAPAAGETVARIPLGKIRPNRHQPRVQFKEEALRELAESIKVHGVAQPLIVSPAAAPGEYELIAGERRLRAARMAGLAEIPCVVRRVTERQRHELALVENLQREDLNPLEEAASVRRLMETFSLTQEDAARVLGKSRSAVANKLRLLDLPPAVRQALSAGEITEGHARALLALPDAGAQTALARRIAAEKLTVRDVERIAVEGPRGSRARPVHRKDADLRRLEEDLQRGLGRRTVIDQRGRHKGWVKLEFYSLEDLDVLLKQLKGGK